MADKTKKAAKSTPVKKRPKAGASGEAARVLEALNRISTAITSELYLEDILRLVVTVTAGVMNSKICSLMLRNESDELEIKATQSINPEYIKKPNLKLGEGIAGKAAVTKKPVVVYNVLQDKEYKHKDLAKSEGLASLLSVPLLLRGRVIGVLNSYTARPHRFTPQEIDILQMVAGQAAVAIENTHLLVKTRVIEEELESRKMVERAKGLLMRRRGLNEQEAFRLLQKESMNRRTSMRKIAEAFLLSDKLEESG